MLQLKEITKSYITGGFAQKALDKVTVNFRRNEFAAILGHSGSGKTTFLNIIGGLDRADSGDLVINNTSTKNFTDAQWDAYRNNSIGFIFQSYNLINHLSVSDNIELGMTLSGVSDSEKRKRAMEVLEKVGLRDHARKKPNQLSGGQMQRVAIARALANDPDIILADEPTGALDTATSRQIMDLIKSIAKEKLVIMVTHNSELASHYTDRVIRFEDGKVVSDSNPFEPGDEDIGYKLRKTSMRFATAIKLSGKNIATKKWRTALTAFASSIGITGIALILSLSSGFRIQIDKFQRDALTEFPVIISQSTIKADKEHMAKMRGEILSAINDEKEYAHTDEVIQYQPTDNDHIHKNKIAEEYLDYIKKIDPKIVNSIGYTRLTGMNLLRRKNSHTFPVSIPIGMSTGMGGNAAGGSSMPSQMSNFSGMRSAGLASFPEPLQDTSESYLEKNYDLLAGDYPSDETDLVLIIDEKNRVSSSVLKDLGFETEKAKSIKFKDIVGTEFKLVSNDDYYFMTDFGTFLPDDDYDAMYDSEDSITLKISGILRLKKDIPLGVVGNGVAYSDRLVQRVTEQADDSEIVKEQRSTNHNVITSEEMDEDEKNTFLSLLGGISTPYIIYIYPTDFSSKEAVLKYLDDYNRGKAEKDMVVYTDLARSITELTGDIMNAITLVLVAFAAISLVVSLIMIGIITYISVLERTKEIGVLRALGARKKDISRVFNAETFIIGVLSGILGIGIAFLLTIPVNRVIEKMARLPNVARLNPLHAIALVTVSIALTLLGGTIPAIMAARKDPVEALRTE